MKTCVLLWLLADGGTPYERASPDMPCTEAHDLIERWEARGSLPVKVVQVSHDWLDAGASAGLRGKR